MEEKKKKNICEQSQVGNSLWNKNRPRLDLLSNFLSHVFKVLQLTNSNALCKVQEPSPQSMRPLHKSATSKTTFFLSFSFITVTFKYGSSFIGFIWTKPKSNKYKKKEFHRSTNAKCLHSQSLCRVIVTSLSGVSSKVHREEKKRWFPLWTSPQTCPPRCNNLFLFSAKKIKTLLLTVLF